MRDIERLARLRNVVCKISGIVVQARDRWTAGDLAPVINHSLASFGPDRVMFAGDWPVCTLSSTYARWVETLTALTASAGEANQKKLFYDNAMRVYRLS